MRILQEGFVARSGTEEWDPLLVDGIQRPAQMVREHHRLEYGENLPYTEDVIIRYTPFPVHRLCLSQLQRFPKVSGASIASLLKLGNAWGILAATSLTDSLPFLWDGPVRHKGFFLLSRKTSGFAHRLGRAGWRSASSGPWAVRITKAVNPSTSIYNGTSSKIRFHGWLALPHAFK